MKKAYQLFILTTSLLCLICSHVWAAWPSDSVRTKNWGSEVLTDSDLEAQFDLLHTYANDSLDETTGHKHDGTSNEGPLIVLNDNTGVIGVTGTLGAVNGGTGLATITDGAVMLGNGTGNIVPLAVTTDGQIVIGDGTTDPTTLAAFTSATGQLKHEYGGVEADISAIAKGGLVSGTGTGTMGITTVGTDDKVLIADSTAGGGISWDTRGAKLISTTSGSGTNTGDITIAANRQYLVTIDVEVSTAVNPTGIIRFNSLSTSVYGFARKEIDFTTSPTETLAADDSHTGITMNGVTMDASTGWLKGQIFIDTNIVDLATDASAFVNGKYNYRDSANNIRGVDIFGFLSGNVTVTSFELEFGSSVDYVVYLYRLGQ